MSDHHHDCPELARCGNHPRWHVVRLIEPEGWSVSCPGNVHFAIFATHAEAITHAQKEATR